LHQLPHFFRPTVLDVLSAPGSCFHCEFFDFFDEFNWKVKFCFFRPPYSSLPRFSFAKWGVLFVCRLGRPLFPPPLNSSLKTTGCFWLTRFAFFTDFFFSRKHRALNYPTLFLGSVDPSLHAWRPFLFRPNQRNGALLSPHLGGGSV